MKSRLVRLAMIGSVAAGLVAGVASGDEQSLPDTNYETAARYWGDALPCPNGETILVAQWEDVVANQAAVEVSNASDAPSASDIIDVDFVWVQPDDVSAYLDQALPEGVTLRIPCVALAPGELVQADPDGVLVAETEEAAALLRTFGEESR